MTMYPDSRFLKLIPLLFFTIIYSCSGKITPVADNHNQVLYPAAPDTAKLIYITSFSGSEDIETASKFKEYVAGKTPAKPIVRPYGVSFSENKIYVCDIGTNTIAIYDLKENTFEYFSPTGQGKFSSVINCFVDENDYLYAADIKRKEVLVFDKERNFLSAIRGDSTFKPSDVFVTADKIYVSSINSKVFIFDKTTHELLMSFPDIPAGEEGRIYQPTNIYVTNKYIYVSDFGEFNIKMFSHEPRYIRTIGTYGSNLGQMIRPKGVAVDAEDNLYVVDAGFEIVQIFNEEGQFLMFFGGPYKAPGDMWLPAKINIDYKNTDYFQKKYLDNKYELDYIIYVTNQYGPDKISVYGFINQKKLYANN